MAPQAQQIFFDDTETLVPVRGFLADQYLCQDTPKIIFTDLEQGTSLFTEETSSYVPSYEKEWTDRSCGFVSSKFAITYPSIESADINVSVEGKGLLHIFTTRFSDEDIFSDLLNEIEETQEYIHASALSQKLNELYGNSKQNPDIETLSIGSMRYFWKFVKCNQNLKYPEIYISALGNIRVQWTESKNEHFVVEFYPDGEVKFVIFSPDHHHQDRVNRVSGLSTIDSLIEQVKAFGVMKWSSNE